MSVIKKPDLKIFAQDAKTGEVETFPDILRGWGVTLDRTAGKPPLEWFNAIGKRVDEWLMYLTQRGVAEWDTTLSYPKTAIVQFNSVVYVSIKETKGEQPDKSQASWSTLGVFLGLGNYYNKTESDKKFQPKGDYAPAGNYQPAGDYATNAALTNGLNGKFDKAGGRTTGSISAEGNITSTAGEQAIQFGYPTGKPAIQTKINGTWWSSYLPAANGTLMQVGDFGVGISLYQSSENLNSTTLGCGFYAVPGSADNPWGSNGSAHILNVRHGGNGFQIGRTTGDMNLSFRLLQNGVFSNPSILYSSANVVVDRNGHLKRNNFPDELSDYPVGAPIPWPQATAPSGFLVCNGQSFNKTTYPLLAKAYPTGVLPDLRGEFLRGLDAGRGVNTGRAVLSAEGDAIRNITGEFANNGNTMSDDSYSAGIGAFAKKRSSNVRSNREVDWVGCTYSFDASRVVPTANENRPRNIAFLYIVRAA
ncbi:phage tail protein [Providencia rettgeri]